MERTMWTDERLDDRFNWIDRRFDEVDARFDRLETRMDTGFMEMRAEMCDIRRLMFFLWGPTMLGTLVSIAAILVTNS
jgi:hypothetical protein